MADDLIEELDAATAEWVRAAHAWNRSDETNYIKVIKLGENLYAGACRMIEAQSDIIEAVPSAAQFRADAIEEALIELLNSLLVCRQRGFDRPEREAMGVNRARFWAAYDKAHLALCLRKDVHAALATQEGA